MQKANVQLVQEIQKSQSALEDLLVEAENVIRHSATRFANNI